MADLETLKQALPIESVVGEYVQLRKAGATYKGLCPFHNEKTPSFTVSPERGSFRCFGCGKGGDVVTFLMEVEKLDFKEAVRRLGRKAGLEVEVDRPQPVDAEAEEVGALNEAAGIFFQGALASSGGAETRSYLERRGATPATIERFGLGWAPAGWDALLRHLRARGHSLEALARAGLVVRNQESGGVYDRFRNRLIFPIRDAKGKLTGFGGRELDGSQPKYLNSPQTKLFDKGSVLYLLDAAGDTARRAGVIVVVEGYMDALMAQQAGFGNVVASLGTALTDRQLTALFRTARKVVMALDADAAGQKAMQQTIRLAYQLFERRRAPEAAARNQPQVDRTLHVAELPDGVDPDEMILADPARWTTLVDGAQPIIEFYFGLIAHADGSAAERRQRANQELLPIIAQIADPLERGHYVDRLATVLEVPASVIASAVEQVRRRPLPVVTSATRGGGTPNGTYAPNRRGVGPDRRQGDSRDWTVEPGTPPDDYSAYDDYAYEDDGSTTDDLGTDDHGASKAIDRGAASAGAGRQSPVAFEAAGERSRQRYLLSMLLRYPRMLRHYADALRPLRPEDDRLGAAWDFLLAHPEARTFEDFFVGLEGDERLTQPYFEALLRDTVAYPALNDAELRGALDGAIALLRTEQLRLQIARCQRRLREASGEEQSRLLEQLAMLAREKVAMDYNRGRIADSAARADVSRPVGTT